MITILDCLLLCIVHSRLYMVSVVRKEEGSVDWRENALFSISCFFSIPRLLFCVLLRYVCIVWLLSALSECIVGGL